MSRYKAPVYPGLETWANRDGNRSDAGKEPH
jgi:hypothetical protein